MSFPTEERLRRRLPPVGSRARFPIPWKAKADDEGVTQETIEATVIDYHWVGSSAAGMIRMSYLRDDATEKEITVVQNEDEYEILSEPQ